jgi:hypothetical protein
MDSRVLKRSAVIVGMIIAVVFSAPAHAQVKPGDFINYDNSAKVNGLLSLGAFDAVLHGMTMKIVPAERIDWPPPYKDATEKYSAQVRLSSDHKSMVGYVAGQPFPLIDPNDPEVATKIIWNEQFRPISSDDYDLRFFDCEDVYIGRNKPIFLLNDTQVGHYAGYDEIGRTEVEPLPTDPDFKKSDRMWLFALYPVLAPASSRGVGIIRYRFQDPKRGDDEWTWTPGARRLRRLNEAILSNPSGLGAWNPDHYGGFNPKVEWFQYKFLGEKSMLATAHAEHSPELRCETDGGGSACPEAWEMRHVYVVEATPDRSKLQGYLGSKDVVFMDSEMWFAPYIDVYDRSGRLFQGFIYWLAYRDRPVPDARVAIYPFKRSFVVGALAMDIQAGEHAMCYLPGRDTPERECWYINMGAVDRSFFDPDAMAKAGTSGNTM